MLNINVVGSNHKVPVMAKDPNNKHGLTWKFKPFDLLTQPNEYFLLMQAIGLINVRSYRDEVCNGNFKMLPGGRSFDDVFVDGRVWISFLVNAQGLLGLTGGNDIAVSDSAFIYAKSRPEPAAEIAAVIIHELAHVNGAQDHNKQAETIVMVCGFYDQCKPGVIG